jgi:hypothetical protein
VDPLVVLEDEITIKNVTFPGSLRNLSGDDKSPPIRSLANAAKDVTVEFEIDTLDIFSTDIEKCISVGGAEVSRRNLF